MSTGRGTITRMWTWHRRSSLTGELLDCEEFAYTEGMTPPAGDGWTLVPGQTPGGRVEGGTGTTKMHAPAPRSRRGDYDGSGIGKVKSTVMKDDGRSLPNTITHHG